MEVPCSLKAFHSLGVLCRLWHDVDEAMNHQQTEGVVKSIRRNVSEAAVTALGASVASAPSSPTRAHEVTEQAWEEKPSGFAATSSSSHDQIMAELAQVQAGFDARFNQVEAHLQRMEAGRCCVLL